jgi:hypothetical protein
MIVRETQESLRTGVTDTTSDEFDNDLELIAYVVQTIKDARDVAEGRRVPRFYKPLAISIEF